MGNLCSCFSPKSVRQKRKTKASKRLPNSSSTAAGALPTGSSNRWTRMRSSRKEKVQDALIQEQAMAAAILFQQHQRNVGPLPFDRSTSLRFPTSGSKKNSLPRSSSSRARSLTDPLLQPQQLVNQDLKLNELIGHGGNINMFIAIESKNDVKLDDLETNHFVLVHGGGFGAWCWYKTIALLEDGGFRVTAVDLTGSGIHSFDTNSITSLPQYVKPVTDFLEKLADGEKLSQGDSNELMRQAQIFLYANGNDHPPTAIDLDKSLLKDLLFNQSPTKLILLFAFPIQDVALASVSMRPMPFMPVLEKLSLSEKNYGSVRRFYIETPEDNAIPVSLQESMINSSPPEQVFRLKGADHSPFFSKPQALHKLLVEISKLPST
ncbi:putative methylesterase 11, chloroplastic [Vitis vinifera]|uniref:Putative methylesterase 11, chloroplastic n=1 Tax=Vitis vinifera TaxID=29760 RepID=A0A438D7J8_VITVI|nr:putative methylesterase 11, chloroplastic [Vitis vinifera]